MTKTIQNKYQCWRTITVTVAATLLKLFFLLTLLFLQNKSMAQTLTVMDANINMEPSLTDSTILQGTYIVELSDSNNVANIEVKISSTPSANGDILLHSFVFDSQAGLPTNFSYARLGNKISLGVGSYTDNSTYFCEVRVQSTNGTWSQPMKFISN